MFELLENYKEPDETFLNKLLKEPDTSILTEDKSKWYNGKLSEEEIKAKESEFWRKFKQKNIIQEKSESTIINFYIHFPKIDINTFKKYFIGKNTKTIVIPDTNTKDKIIFESLIFDFPFDEEQNFTKFFNEIHLQFKNCQFNQEVAFKGINKSIEQLSFDNCLFKTQLLFLSTIISASDTHKLENLSISNCEWKEFIYIDSLQILNNLFLYELDFAESFIKNLDISGTRILELRNLNFDDAKVININFGNQQNILRKLSPKNFIKEKRNTFSNLKHFYDEMANYIDANICYEIEMQIYEKELEAKKWLNVPNWINKFIDKTFSSFGIFSILVFIAIFINFIPINENFSKIVLLTLLILILTLLFCNKYLITDSNETSFQEKFILRFAKLISNFSNSWLRPLFWSGAVVVIFSSFITPNIDYTSTNQTPATFLNAFDENRQITDFDIESKTNLNSYNKSAHFLLVSNSNEKILNEKNLTFAYDDRFNYSFKEQYIPMLKDDIWTKIYFSLSNSISPFISNDKAWFSKTTTKAIVTSTIELILLWFSLGAFFVAVKRKLRR